MPVTSWWPQNVLGPVTAGFRPACYQTKAWAMAHAPGPRTRSAVRLTFTSPLGATLDVLRRGRVVYPILSGSAPGTRITERWFVPPAWQGKQHVVKAIQHPGTDPNPFLNRAAAGFPALYAANVRRRWR